MRIKHTIIKGIMALGLCLSGLGTNIVLADGEKGSSADDPVTNSEELVSAINVAKDGATIYLSEGTFSTYGNEKFGSSENKSFTFVGAGSGTVWQIGPQIIEKPDNGEYNSDYTFKGCKNITFQSMTLTVPGDYNYLGFSHIYGDVLVENCTINGRTAYWGYNSTTFKNTEFNAPSGGYALWTYTGKEMTFDSCTFNSSGKMINVYTDFSAGKNDITVNFKDCTVKNTNQNKAVMKINDSNMGDYKYTIKISGKNNINNVKTGEIASRSVTCSNLFGFDADSPKQNSGRTDVYIDDELVWTEGKMVSHSIDTENDKYTDGYEEDNFLETSTEWVEQDDGSYTRTTTRVCNYCGYKEEVDEIGYKVTYTDGIDGEEIFKDEVSEILASGSSTPKFTGGTPTRDGYTFAGWSPTVSDTVEENVTYVAQWTKDSETPTDPTTPTDEISKSKTAEWVKEGKTAEVTLSLPADSYQKTIDVVFVLDRSFSADQKLAASQATSLLLQLAEYNELKVKSAVIVEGGYIPILDSTDLLPISYGDEAKENLDTLTNMVQDTKYDTMTGSKGSNLEAGIEVARELLKGDSEVESKEDKNIIILSDAGAFSWYEDGTVYSNAYKDDYYRWCNPQDFKERYSIKELRSFNDLMQLSEDTVDKFALAKMDEGDWPSTQPNSNRTQYQGYYTEDQIPGFNEVREWGDPYADGYVTTREAALYHAAKSIQEATDDSHVILVAHPYHPENSNEYGLTEQFKDWVSENTNATVYRTLGEKSSEVAEWFSSEAYSEYQEKCDNLETVFKSISDELVYLVGAGSTVTDYIGTNFSLTDLSSIKLTVNGETLNATVDQTGQCVYFGEKTGTSENPTRDYQYAVKVDNNDKHALYWYINENVSKAGGVQLTYQLKLSNVETKSGTYTVDTNEQATLYPKDSQGKQGDGQDFEKPTLNYTVYTVTYTDGVDGEDVFKDQSTGVIKNGDTPLYEGTPTRDGYTFKGWSPEVSDTVTGDVTYVAQWEKNSTPTTTPTSTPTATPTATPTSKPSKPSSPSTPSSSVTPVSPAAPASTAKSSKIVDTSDSSNMNLYIGLGSAAVIACVILFITKKRFEN